MNNPCYDTKTKTDCPRRCAGCNVDCPDWADYVKQREELYKKRQVEQKAQAIMSEHIYERVSKIQKDKMKSRRWKFYNNH